MNVNPEFRRNIWLEITPYRLVGMPLILLAVFYLTWLSEKDDLTNVTATTSMALFFIISLIWGTKLSSESITNEIRDHTWDGQRMSAITPWSLSWGKLFGSTIFTWYGAAICLLVYLVSASGKSPETVFKTILISVLVALLAHSISILSSLVALQKERKYYKSHTAAFLLIGIMVALPFFNMTYDSKEIVKWYGLPFAKIDFTLLTLLAYAAWAVYGIYNLMRIELQMKNSPWPWLGFVLFLMVHLSGFFHESRRNAADAFGAVYPPLVSAFYIAGITAYLTAFTERKDFLSLHNLVRLAEAGNLRGLLLRAPRWLLSLPLAMAAGTAAIVYPFADYTAGAVTVFSLLAASMAFIMRDFAVMIFFNLGRKGKRADMMTMLYLAVAYGLLPAILGALQMKSATVLFWPRPEMNPVAVLAAPFAEAALAGYLMYRRWRQRLAEEGR